MNETGSPFAPHSTDETTAMLEAIGVENEETLFDVPDAIRFDGDLGIAGSSEREVRQDITAMLGRNDDVIEFLGRGHYDHYVPSVVDHLADRSEFLTSYTQYQPEVAQGFLQALFEYQSILVELTGLEIANASMYDHATALGEAALLAKRIRETQGERILVPDILRDTVRAVLENYIDGPGLVVDSYPTAETNVDVEGLQHSIDEEVAMVYVESPNDRGAIEERLREIATITHDNDAIACLGSDPVALALLEEPADVGMDVVVGDAATLGLGAAYGTGLGLFACREDYLRQVPGRLVGASEDAAGRRAFTLTLQTREQHIRRERATSNICTNQAWISLRTAMHAALLGADGLVELAEECVTHPRELAARIDEIDGIRAPADDRHHFREFVAETDRPATEIAAGLRNHGFVVHVRDDHEIQLCVTETNAHAADELVAAMEVEA